MKFTPGTQARIALLMVLTVITPCAFGQQKASRQSALAIGNLFPVTMMDQPTCDDLCNGWRKEKASRTIVIDANTGEVLEGVTRYVGNDPVKIIFVNKNPFKYIYRFRIDTQELTTANILTFLKALPFTFPDSIIGQSGITPALAPAQPCSADPVVKLLEETGNRLINRSNDLKATLENFSKALDATEKAYNKLLEDTTQDDISKACVKVCGEADTFLKALTELKKIDTTKFEKDLADLKKDVADFKPRVTGLTLPPPGNETAVKKCLTDTYVTPLDTTVSKLDTDLATYKDGVKKNEKVFQAVQDSYTENPFYEIHSSEPIGEAASVRIRIFRTERRVENATEKAVPKETLLTIGESPISLSAGIGFSTIDEVKIIREATQKSDGTAATRFGRELNSNFKAVGVIQLNAHLVPIKRINGTFAISVGVGFTNRDDSASYEFFAGPSLGFLRNRFFITAAYSTARVQRLAGGFKEGDLIPDNLPDPLPVQKNFQSGAMFTFTYKIR